MDNELRFQTTVLPGHRIEVSVPELPEGGTVELIVRSPAPAPPASTGVLDFLRTLPPGPRSCATWEEFEQEFQKERDAWEH